MKVLFYMQNQIENQMNASNVLLLAAACILLPAMLQAQKGLKEKRPESAIMEVIQQQESGWNAGRLDEYMKGYAKSETTRFISGGAVTFGYDTVLARYRRGYPDKATMGTLAFSQIRIGMLTGKEALVYGKWELKREKDNPWGMFTLLFRKTKAGWRIVHDHTSSAK